MDEHEAEMDSSIAVIRRLQDGLRAERETNKRLLKVIEAARALAQQPYFCGQVLTQALLDAQHDPEYAAVVRDCLRDYDLLRKAFDELEGKT